jgi:hypothetical protein
MQICHLHITKFVSTEMCIICDQIYVQAKVNAIELAVHQGESSNDVLP